MRSLIRLPFVLNSTRTFHSTKPLINHQFHAKPKQHVDFPVKPKGSNMASEAREYTDEFNEAIVSQDLEPVINLIFSKPKTGIKRKEIHIHPIQNKNKFKLTPDISNYKLFMDIEDQHVQYLRSEGFKVDKVTYTGYQGSKSI